MHRPRHTLVQFWPGDQSEVDVASRDVRERMSRVDRLRRQKRVHISLEIGIDTCAVFGAERFVLSEDDATSSELGNNFFAKALHLELDHLRNP